VVSKAKKVNDKTDNEEWTYVGQWAVEEPTVLKGIDGDKGLGKRFIISHVVIQGLLTFVRDSRQERCRSPCHFR